ncbi:hypothetical protein [Comamonas aquatica]|uniref:hypothetical protein n=1 Tax=Comamonas aquatica TaxID=225991 RepID=UPI00244AB647|nr:hypothetical protein [Comamonas aquatica]MDH1678604.1 hypothetical protein [Comamonas aquatica]
MKKQELEALKLQAFQHALTFKTSQYKRRLLWLPHFTPSPAPDARHATRAWIDPHQGRLLRQLH